MVDYKKRKMIGFLIRKGQTKMKRRQCENTGREQVKERPVRNPTLLTLGL